MARQVECMFEVPGRRSGGIWDELERLDTERKRHGVVRELTVFLSHLQVAMVACTQKVLLLVVRSNERQE